MLNPMRDKREGMYRGGGRGDGTCDHGSSRRSLVGKTFDELSWKVKVMMKKKQIYICTRYKKHICI